MIDVSKLIIGGVLLATILKFENLNKPIVIAVSVTTIMTLAILGFRLLDKSNKD
ncbi:MAG: DUF6722 family protein [Bacteroidota bacterium]|nr:DUF6722 family protein [Bacteroidota bacterium]